MAAGFTIVKLRSLTIACMLELGAKGKSTCGRVDTSSGSDFVTQTPQIHP
jgi:hypothetical protein